MYYNTGQYLGGNREGGKWPVLSMPLLQANLSSVAMAIYAILSGLSIFFVCAF